MGRKRQAVEQLQFLWYEIQCGVNHKHWRWLTIWFGGIGVNISYRLDRFLYLLLGEAYTIMRLLFLPLFFLLRVLGGQHEIHYRSQIGKGLQVLHPTLGVVVSGQAICGEHLILTGGNCIGGRRRLSAGSLVIGNNVMLGANAVVLGPIFIGNGCNVGAGAVAIHDAVENSVLVGVPAKALISRTVHNETTSEQLD